MDLDQSISSQLLAAKKPRALVCFICGKEYGLKRIQNHISKCSAKWNSAEVAAKEEAREAGKVYVVKPCPQAPPGYLDLISGGSVPKEEAMLPNEQIFMEDSILHSSRMDESVQDDHHLDPVIKSSTECHSPSLQEQPHKDLPEEQDNSFDPSSLAQCPHCQRTFLPERLQIHLRSCKAGKPLKKKRSEGGQGTHQRNQHQIMPLQRKAFELTLKEEQDAEEKKIVPSKRAHQKSSQPKQVPRASKKTQDSPANGNTRRPRTSVSLGPNHEAHKEEIKEEIKKRKKSVHFPENPVIPIDDSSYGREDDDQNQRAVPQEVAQEVNNQPRPYLKKNSRCAQQSRKEDSPEKQPSNWRAEREAFKKAMMISKKINEVEKNDTLDKQDAEQKIAELSKHIPSQVGASKMKECPFCKRSFLEQVADRHIPFCANAKHRPKPPPTKTALEKQKDQRRQVHLKMGSPKQKQPPAQTPVPIQGRQPPQEPEPKPIITPFKPDEVVPSLDKIKVLKNEEVKTAIDQSKKRLQQLYSVTTAKPEDSQVAVKRVVTSYLAAVYTEAVSIVVAKEVPALPNPPQPMAQPNDPLEQSIMSSVACGISVIQRRSRQSRKKRTSTIKSISGIGGGIGGLGGASQLGAAQLPTPNESPFKPPVIETDSETPLPKYEKPEDLSAKLVTPKVKGFSILMPEVTPTKENALPEKKGLMSARQPKLAQNLQKAEKSPSSFVRTSALQRAQNFSNVLCPYCNRKFSEKASQRHIAYCKEKHLLQQFKEKGERKKESSVSSARELSRVGSAGKILKKPTSFRQPGKPLSRPNSQRATLQSDSDTDAPIYKVSMLERIRREQASRKEVVASKAVTIKLGGGAPVKFCTGCGWAFPSTQMKFCGECGQRRV